MRASLRAKPHFILGYNGCDKDVGEQALGSDAADGLIGSSNDYDWLGSGLYFWEADWNRALQWAQEKHESHVKREKTKGTPVGLRRPYAIGAIINLGTCLDLTTIEGVELLQEGYEGYVKDCEELGLALPKNDHVRHLHYLDYQVINYTCRTYEKTFQHPIETVRSLFPEGDDLYGGSAFKAKTHIQICVRKPNRSIVGYFRVLGL